MKNAKQYEKKLKKLLSSQLADRPKTPWSDEQDDRVKMLLRGILGADAPVEGVEKALTALEAEFVDYNELRVAPPKEIADCVGKSFPDIRRKASMINAALQEIYARTFAVNIDYMDEMSKRDLRRHLAEIGLSPYAAAYVVLMAFGGHAVPVDQSLVEALRIDDCVHPDSDIPDVQGFLERVIPQKDARAAHEFFREYVEEKMPQIESARATEQARREEAEKANEAPKAAGTGKAGKKKKKATAKASKGKSASRKSGGAKSGGGKAAGKSSSGKSSSKKSSGGGKSAKGSASRKKKSSKKS